MSAFCFPCTQPYQRLYHKTYSFMVKRRSFMKRMTRALCLLLAPLMLLTVVGCSNTPPDKSGNSSTVSSAATSGYPNAESETSSSDSSVSDSTDNSGSNSTTVRTTGNNRSSTNTTAKTTSGNTSDINMKDPQKPLQGYTCQAERLHGYFPDVLGTQCPG